MTNEQRADSEITLKDQEKEKRISIDLYRGIDGKPDQVRDSTDPGTPGT
jgi:hypothetical protein